MANKKIVVLSIITLLLFTAALAMVIFLAINNSKKDDDNPVIEDIVQYSDYNKDNKDVFVKCMEQLLQIKYSDDETQYNDVWKDDLIKETFTNLVDAFETAEIDIDVFYEVSKFVYDLPEQIKGMSFDLGEGIENTTLSLGDLYNVFSKVNNINKIVDLYNRFYATGLTDDDIALILWHFCQSEAETLSENALFFNLMLNVDVENEYGTYAELAKLLMIDAIPYIQPLLDNMGKDNFIINVKQILSQLREITVEVKSYSVISFSQIIVDIIDGTRDYNDLLEYSKSINTSLKNRLDEDGKFLDYSGISYPVLSIITKTPFLIRFLNEHMHFGDEWIAFGLDINTFFTSCVKTLNSIEDLTNAAVNGIINVTEYLSENKSVLVRDETGVIVDQISIVEALADNMSNAFDGESFNANADTVVIFCKIFAKMFDGVGLTYETITTLGKELVESFMLALVAYSAGTDSDIDVNDEDVGNAAGNLIIFFRSDYMDDLMDTIFDYIGESIGVITEISKLDLGASERDLYDISSNIMVLKDSINITLNALYNGEFITADHAATWVATYVLQKFFVSQYDYYQDNWKSDVKTILGEEFSKMLGLPAGASMLLHGLSTLTIVIDMSKLLFGVDLTTFSADSIIKEGDTEEAINYKRQIAKYVREMANLADDFDKYMMYATWPVTALFEKVFLTSWNTSVQIPEYITNIFYPGRKK